MAKQSDAVKKKVDKDLVYQSKAFVGAFAASAAKEINLSNLAGRSGMSMGPAGFVEIDASVAAPLAKLMARAEKLLGPSAAHSEAIYSTALRRAQQAVHDNLATEDAATYVIDGIWDQALTSYVWVSPNRLFKLMQGLTEIKIGRLRAMSTSTFAARRAAQYPDEKLTIVPDEAFSLRMGNSGAVSLSMSSTCWVVEVDAIDRHVETEGKWAIDVAVSLLRLLHHPWGGNFPSIGKVESHPTKAGLHHSEGVMFEDARARFGGNTLPNWYEIDASVVAVTTTSKFQADADVVFAPPKLSLAERMSQGLGWLTRGRQSEDRAERLLYFFTAIEALLSNDDKTSPVTQTIARHASVLLSNDNQRRAEIASRIKKLYEFRSALVHSGNRSVSGSAADETQILAELLFHTALTKADLKSAHAAFNQSLATASFGTVWPAIVAADAQ